ncbi:MAG: hypothetical protein AMXMBFR31_01460 [Candidatus Desulfobacillus denitrificans]|nr:MAG: hypothetical protein F9K21_07445 [Rhodocyclaceae bacterium]MCG3145820.1 hypothetical protein [Gammaproteobacteria bacterium]
MSPPAIMFVFTAESYHREAAPVIDDFARRGWPVRVVLGFHSEHTRRIEEACRKKGIPVELVPAGAAYGKPADAGDAGPVAPVAEIARETVWARVAGLLRERLRRTGIGRLRHFPGYVAQCLRRRRIAEALIGRLKPSAVVMGSYHSSGQIDNAVARACRRRSIPMYCIPNSPYLGTLTLRVGRLNHLEQGMASPGIRVRHGLINRVLGWLFPSWTSVLPDGDRAFYWDPLMMLAATLTGLQMNRLWLKPALDFKRVFVFSDYSRDLLLADGYPAGRIVVSAPPLLDAVRERIGDAAHEEALFSHIRLPAGTPFVLFNVEPSAEHDYCDWDRHWRQFHETLAAVAACGLPVVLSLHPLCRIDNYRFAEAQYGVTISTDFRIHDLYPYCAISVSFPCSTNLLALTFEKPLVIYDHFGILTRDEESRTLNMIPGACVAQSAGEVAECVRTIAAGATERSGGFPRPPAGAARAADIIFSTIEGDLSNA